jgi:hypothetical protein
MIRFVIRLGPAFRSVLKSQPLRNPHKHSLNEAWRLAVVRRCSQSRKLFCGVLKSVAVAVAVAVAEAAGRDAS